MNRSKVSELIARFSALAKDAHRRGDVQARAQAEENIREITARAAAKKIIASLYS